METPKQSCYDSAVKNVYKANVVGAIYIALLHSDGMRDIINEYKPSFLEPTPPPQKKKNKKTQVVKEESSEPTEEEVPKKRKTKKEDEEESQSGGWLGEEDPKYDEFKKTLLDKFMNKNEIIIDIDDTPLQFQQYINSVKNQNTTVELDKFKNEKQKKDNGIRKVIDDFVNKIKNKREPEVKKEQSFYSKKYDNLRKGIRTNNDAKHNQLHTYTNEWLKSEYENMKKEIKHYDDNFRNSFYAIQKLIADRNLDNLKDNARKVPFIQNFVPPKKKENVLSKVMTKEAAIAVGIVSSVALLNKIYKVVKKNKLLKEDIHYYNCMPKEKCKQLEYDMKPTFMGFLSNMLPKDNVLYMYTNKHNKGLYFDKYNFVMNTNITGDKLLSTFGLETEIMNLKNSKYINYAFNKKPIGRQLEILGVIPENPKILIVNYEYIPFPDDNSEQTEDAKKELKKQDKLLKHDNTQLEKVIHYNKLEYVLDSMIISNFNKHVGDYLMAGIVCNQMQYLYIGPGFKDDKIMDNTCSTHMVPYDWMNIKTPFCYDKLLCKIKDKPFEEQVNTNLCFNKTTGTRIFTYIRNS
jgi:hypothetical protein